MKNILIALILAGTGVIQAQVSQDAFEKAVDYVNCKTVELSLKKDASYKDYQQNCPCANGAGYTKINSFLTTTGNLDKTLALSAEIESLKKTFKENSKQEDLIKFLSETIFADKAKYQKLYSFADTRKADPAFVSFKTALKQDLSKVLLPKQTEGDNEANLDNGDQGKISSLEKRVKDLEDKFKSKVEDKSWFDGFTFQIDVFSIIISVILMLLAIKLLHAGADEGNDISDNIRSYVKQKISDAQFRTSGNSANSSSSSEVRGLKDEIDKLKAELRDLRLKVDGAKVPFEIVQPKYEQPWQDTKQPEIKSTAETFYLSTPNSDGSFNESSASTTYKEGASIYRFTKIGNNRAKFQIDEREASVKLALQYPDKNIDPVCDAVNAFNPKARRITTVDGGEAELVGDRWIKNTKAKISYES